MRLSLGKASRAQLSRVTSSARSMSSTASVWVDKNTRVICQGFTGKQVRGLITLRASCLVSVHPEFLHLLLFKL